MRPSEQIDKMIADLSDWRGELIAEIRRIVLEVDPEIVEEWKWMGSPCWYHNGLVCLANAHKDKVKLTFYQGASIADPDKLLNAGLDGNKWRAIDVFKNDVIDEATLGKLVASAVKFNISKKTV